VKASFSITLILICLLAFVVTGQKFVEKPYDTWSREQAIGLLSDSSWARTYQNLSAAASSDMREAARSQSDTRLSGQERSRSDRVGGMPPVYARLHSALPVRQALARLNQIAANYDKMDEKGKEQFNETAKRLLECSICQTHYVVTILQAPNPTGQFVEEAIFQGMTFEQMKENIWLEDDAGKRRALAQFMPPQKRGDGAVFFFERNDDKGNPFLSDSSKELNVVFNNNFFVASNRFAPLIPRRFDFKVSKMKIGDKLMF
jgi:hypothetical protein